jgi:N-acetylglucosamine transport system substrate-binding protein
MSSESKSINRRTVLRGAAATAALVPLAGVVAACAGGGTTGTSDTSSSSSSPAGNSSSSEPAASSESGSTESSAAPAGDGANPFGLKSGSTVNAVIFNGGYGYDYVTFAGKEAEKKNDGVTFDVKPATKIATELQPQFVAGNPPDLIDNSGADLIAINTILDQLSDLSDVFEANNYEGTKIADTLFGGVKGPGTFGGKFAAINYVMTIYAVWYSGSLFDANGWTPPKTWDEALDLGAKAKEKGKYLFVWGKEAATYYEWFAIDGAIKEAGDEVRLGLENLKPDCWSHPAIQGVFKAMETCVKNGYFVPGGAGTQFTDAQAKWSNDQ